MSAHVAVVSQPAGALVPGTRRAWGEPGRPVLETRGLVKDFGSEVTTRVLFEIDLIIREREFVALTGVSGSGKSTLLSIIAGLDTPTQGTVHLAGQDQFALSEDDRAALRAQKSGFVFQSFQPMGNLSAL